MDPRTVVTILAIHLVCSGGLMFLIGRHMPPRGGLGLWAAGGVVYGVAFFGRLAGERGDTGWWLLGLDAAMVAAALLFLCGLQQFGRRPMLPPRVVAGVVLLFAALQGLATAQWGAQGRYVTLNLALGGLYAYLAWSTAAHTPRQAPPLRPPLWLFAAVTGVQAVLTLLRGASMARHGHGSAYTGLWSQVYYGYASLAAVMLALTLLWMVFVRLNMQLAELASRDALTRVYNRNGLDEVTRRHFAARHPAPMTLLMVDLDHFKRVNDAHGHFVGDRLLKAVADTLAQHLRGSDFVARIGGEEFLVGCIAEPGTSPEASATAAVALGERLRAAIGVLALPLPPTSSTAPAASSPPSPAPASADGAAPAARVVRCTASIGVSRPLIALADLDRAQQEADRALYAAKSAGRDRVVAA